MAYDGEMVRETIQDCHARCRVCCSGVCNGRQRDWLNATYNEGEWECVAKEQVGSVDGTFLT